MLRRNATTEERTGKVAQVIALSLGIALFLGMADPVSAQDSLVLDPYVDLFEKDEENASGDESSVMRDEIIGELYDPIFSNLEPIDYEDLFNQIKDIVSNGRDARQLLSALRLANEQLQNTIWNVLPVVSLNSGENAPSMFTYSKGPGTYFTGSGEDQSIDVALSLGLSQNLPTGAKVYAQAGSNWNYDNPEGGSDDWDLTISPSLVAGIVQPLFLDGNFISGDIIATGLNNAENQRDSANEAYINTTNDLSLQIINLLSQRLQLIEQLSLLHERLDILEIQQVQADQDFARGVISRTALNNQMNIFNTQKNASVTLEREIRVLEGNIKLLLDSQEADQINLQLFDNYLIPQMAINLVEPNWSSVRQEILLRDSRLKEAERDKVEARAALLLAGQADAPVLSVNLLMNAASFDSSNYNLILSANLSISDPFRRDFLLQKELYEEKILQANLSYEKALGEIDIEVDEYRNRWQQLIRDVSTQLEDFRLAKEAYEEELIRFAQGGSNEIPMRQTVLQVHEKAFMALQTLRSIYSLNIEVLILTGKFG